MTMALPQMTPDLVQAFQHALQAALTLVVSHAVGVGIVMYMDLSGRWERYAICKSRSKKTMADYWPGWKSFCVDLVLVFIPCVTLLIWFQADAIFRSRDTVPQATAKLVSGYVLGKIWAAGAHYLLHHPRLYAIHRRHHQKPAHLVASSAWEDSFIEYAVMEMPSFGLTLCIFPTLWWMHLMHFVWHGMDGASSHSGFKAPGLLGFLFDGEYHYYHHAHLTVNYAELEILDKLFGTHHSQKERFSKRAS